MESKWILDQVNRLQWCIIDMVCVWCQHTCRGILFLSASMLTTNTIVTVTSTVEMHPTRLSQESLLKLGMKIIGTMQTMLTATAK